MICAPRAEAVTDQSPSVVARLTTDARSAHRILDALAECFESPEAAVGAFESGAGEWTVSIHFLDPPNETAVRALVALAAGTDAANALAFERIAARDWVKASLDGLPPVAAGRFVVHGAHDRARVPPNAIGIEIEAALAFGTGHHGTTRGCLIALDALIQRRRKRPHPSLPRKRGRDRGVLDVGTGSGVLAIAAARALRAPVLASDIDPKAVAIAHDNARANRAAVTFIHAPGVGAHRIRARAPFDLVLANILLVPLQKMAVPLARLAAPGARIVLSGLLPAQQSAALAAYRAQGLTLERRILLDGWATLVLRRGRRA
jgi:ribosomal protein L11 methyltransferase